jgi:hypothetical protein
MGLWFRTVGVEISGVDPEQQTYGVVSDLDTLIPDELEVQQGRPVP